MCGIAGFISPEKILNRDTLGRFCDALAHRGPDADGIWQNDDKRAGFAHTRLSIIDPSPAAHQPMRCDHLTIVFNGAIYNYPELKAVLKSLGHRFETKSDTEVLLKAYQEWGERCLERLNGMFAFAIWDDQAQALFLARDRIGEKPLFYRGLKDGGIAFASEPQVLADLPHHAPRTDKTAMVGFLMLGYNVGTDTCWQDVKSLPPAHRMHVDAKGVQRIERYWDILPYFENKHDVQEDEACAHVRDLIDDATKIRLRADVPYGAFLSAGMDSNTVVAAMKQHKDAITTFSIGFDDQAAYDESPVAARAAAHFGTSHHRFSVPDNLPAMKGLIADMACEPIGDAGYIPMASLSKQARQHVKMVLSGDGGDEIFAGYPTYIANAIHHKVSPFIPFKIALPQSKTRRSLYFKLNKFLNALPMDAGQAHFSWRVLGRQDQWASFMDDHGVAWDDIYAPFERHYARAVHLSPLNQALYTDLHTFLPGSVLAKTDRATMRYGLEVRAPLLDHRIAEYAAGLPPSYKLRFRHLRYEGKYILRQSQRSRLPEFLFAHPKRGFSMPVPRWINDHKAQHAGVFDRLGLQDIFDAHKGDHADDGLICLNAMILSGLPM